MALCFALYTPYHGDYADGHRMMWLARDAGSGGS